MLKISKVVFNEKSTYTELNLDLESSEIYIDKSSIGKDITEKINYNFLAVGRKNTEAKKIIAELEKFGIEKEKIYAPSFNIINSEYTRNAIKNLLCD